MTKQFVLQYLVFYVLPRHTNIMTDKGFNLFDECAARCIHLLPPEEECTSSSWRESKMWHLAVISGIKIWQHAKFTEDDNWNKWKWSQSQNKDLGGKWYCQTLKELRIISSKMKNRLVILSCCFSCLHIQRIGIEYTNQLLWKIIA